MTFANKTRQPGYWNVAPQIINSGEFDSMPALVKTWIPNTMSELCRHDQRVLTRECVGCTKPSDVEYLKRVGLWVDGISHEVTE